MAFHQFPVGQGPSLLGCGTYLIHQFLNVERMPAATQKVIAEFGKLLLYLITVRHAIPRRHRSSGIITIAAPRVDPRLRLFARPRILASVSRASNCESGDNPKDRVS